eukprot:TRINITY_DN20903_c0_g1_i1.p1 TRINITY_DN20903_c0_g1~~TRINITY_DN20903_c0_g1_i1.p1  ORF type:complete len:273 (+),score=56.44 TRINITY_DN20903_c0_g1_i1:58-876(+)
MALAANRFAVFASDEEESTAPPTAKSEILAPPASPTPVARAKRKIAVAKRGKKRRKLDTGEAADVAVDQAPRPACAAVEADVAADAAADAAAEAAAAAAKAAACADVAPSVTVGVGGSTSSTEDQKTISLPGGVTVKVLQTGPASSPIARKGSVVKLLYEGWLPGKNGKRFDVGDVDFVVGDGSTVRGIQEGVVGMRVGERRLIRMPSKMGYGKKGKPPKVPPNADLEFVVLLTQAGVDFAKAGEQDQTTMRGVSKLRREKMRRRGRKPRAS